MFTLTIDGRQLILDNDFGVPLIYTNPCWCFNEIPAPLCLDVTIPDNDVNRNSLGHPGRFSKMAKSNDRKFPGAELRWGGYLYIYGTLVITEANEKGYSGIIQSELRSLSDAQREKHIGDHRLKGEIAFENKLQYDPDTDLYCTIKVSNSGFFVDKGETEPWEKPIVNPDGTPGVEDTTREVLTRKFDTTAEYKVNLPSPAGVKTTADGDHVVVVSPYPFITRLIELILQENKFFLRTDFLATHETLKTLCLYHNRSICKTEIQTETVETTYDNPYYDSQYNEANGISQVDVITTQTWLTDTFQLKKLLPKIELNELLLSIQNLTNTFYHPTGIDDVDNIDRESLFDRTPFDLSKYRVSRWLPGKRQNLCLKFGFDHDSDDLEFNDNFSDISSREEDIKEPVMFFSDLRKQLMPNPEIGEIRLVKVEKMYYEYRQEVVNEKDTLMWAPITIDLQSYKFNPAGDETEEIKTLFSTLRMHESGYPVAYQKGHTSQFAQFTENFTPRLLFYNGSNMGGATAPDGMSIDWKSIVARRYRRTAPFYANALQATADFRFPGNIFYKILNEIYVPYDDTEGSFFIKEMEVNADNSEFVNATLTVFKNEDNVFDATTQVVGGGGEHEEVPVFVAKYVGVNKYGRPTILNAEGLGRQAPVYSELSGALYAERSCVAYSEADKLLFVGGRGGLLTIYDLQDPEQIAIRVIRIFAGREITCVRVVNGHLLFGSTEVALANKIYYQPYYSSLGEYSDLEAVAYTNNFVKPGIVVDFVFADGHYYAATLYGEVFTASDLSNWTELFDTTHDFYCMAVSQNRLYVFGNNDHNYVAERADRLNWDDFGLSSDSYHYVMEAIAAAGDNVICISNDAYNGGIFAHAYQVTNPSVAAQPISPGLSMTLGGAAYIDGATVIAMKDLNGTPKLAIYQVPQVTYRYVDVMELYAKVWGY